MYLKCWTLPIPEKVINKGLCNTDIFSAQIRVHTAYKLLDKSEEEENTEDARD